MKIMPPLWRGLVAYLLLRGRSIQTYAQASICKYTHFTVDDGLPPVEVYSLLQDRTGCTWLATGVGLCYFDEYLFLAQVSWFKVASCLAALFLAGLVVYAVAARNQNKRLNRLVEIKARELNAKMKDLAEANLKLERSNRELQQFAHVASHDLKSPLRNIASFIQLLKARAGDKLSANEKEYIDFVISGAHHMDRVINGLLAFSQAGQLNDNKETIRLESVIQDVLQNIKVELEQQNATIELVSPLPDLHFNRANAEQLFQNLLSNAIKFHNGAPPVIQIGCRSKPEEWLFFVQDNGIGIDENYQKKIFEIFQRLHTQEQYPGTGAGLAICKKIVEDNGGKIWFKSPKGKGTTFYFTLPKA